MLNIKVRSSVVGFTITQETIECRLLCYILPDNYYTKLYRTGLHGPTCIASWCILLYTNSGQQFAAGGKVIHTGCHTLSTHCHPSHLG